jgi:hypothetical protein
LGSLTGTCGEVPITRRLALGVTSHMGPGDGSAISTHSVTGRQAEFPGVWAARPQNGEEAEDSRPVQEPAGLGDEDEGQEA